MNNGHAILVYDERNPASQTGGGIFSAYIETKDGLKDSRMLRKISWQRIIDHIGNKKNLNWLTDELGAKYGF
jgi:hypothetical protein